MNNNHQQQSQRIHQQVPLAAVHFLAGIIAAGPPFSVVLTD